MLEALKTMSFMTARLKGAVPACLAVAVMAVVVFTNSPAVAGMLNVPGVSPTVKNETGQEVEKPNPEHQREITTLALTHAKAEMQRKFITPAGISRQEVEERHRLLNVLVLRLNAKLNLISEAEALRNARATAERQVHDWPGVHKQQHYSVLVFDELKKQVVAARAKVHGLDSARELFGQQVNQFRNSVAVAKERDRLATDRLEGAFSPEQRLAASWRKGLTGIQVRSAEAALDWAVLRDEVLGERLAVARAELDLLVRQVAEARNRVVFSRADLNSALAHLKASRATLDEEMELALAREALRISELARAQQVLDGFKTREGSAPGNAEYDELAARHQAALAWAESSRFESEVNSALISINQYYSALWQQRYDATVGSDSEKRQAIMAEFRKFRDKLQPWRVYLQRQIELYQASERNQETRLAAMDGRSPIRQAVQDLRDALHVQLTQGERLYAALEQAEENLTSWQEDIELLYQTRSIRERFRDSFRVVLDVLHRLWNFELFVVEDTVEVAGKKLITSHGVTVGKSVGALLLLFVGYITVSFLGRRMRRIMVARFGIGEHQANLIRRGFVSLAIFVLLIVTLNLARIPITVFAFFGGALAIGVGFGTQTLIKNLICGIIILLERKVQVGDTVEVDGVQGKITSVDIRASTVLGFDGVETVIPNATFLENKVTNWTHTNAALRRIVRVGVAYGSPVERVSDILVECANRHGLVLKNPPPQVFFEEFADSYLSFALYFWINYGPTVNPLMVASDLRFMIDQRFAEEKIVVAFPQRDIHLDASGPLRVQLVTQNDPSVIPEGKGTEMGPKEQTL